MPDPALAQLKNYTEVIQPHSHQDISMCFRLGDDQWLKLATPDIAFYDVGPRTER